MKEERKIEDEHCAACGQRIGYRSSVSRGTVQAIKSIAKAVERKGLNILNIKKEMVDEGLMKVTTYHNLSHMVRLGLLAYIDGEVGNYALTRKAVLFLKGEPIPRWVLVEKQTSEHGSRTIERSEDLCTIRDFEKKGEYWEVPGFDIVESRVIRQDTVEI